MDGEKEQGSPGQGQATHPASSPTSRPKCGQEVVVGLTRGGSLNTLPCLRTQWQDRESEVGVGGKTSFSISLGVGFHGARPCQFPPCL